MVGYWYPLRNNKAMQDTQKELPVFRTDRLWSCRVNSSKEPAEQASTLHRNKLSSNASMPAPSPALRLRCLTLHRVFAKTRVPAEKLCTALLCAAVSSRKTCVFLSSQLRSHNSANNAVSWHIPEDLLLFSLQILWVPWNRYIMSCFTTIQLQFCSFSINEMGK